MFPGPCGVALVGLVAGIKLLLRGGSERSRLSGSYITGAAVSAGAHKNVVPSSFTCAVNMT